MNGNIVTTMLADRLKNARESLGKSQKEMAELLGVGLKSWQVYEQNKSVPGSNVLEAMVKLGFNANRLLTGEGPMGLDKNAVLYDLAEGHKTADISSTPAEGYVYVPRYEVAASAGGGAMIHSEQIVDHLSFKAEWVHNTLGVPVKDLALINVLGDSMEPALSNGDLILIDMGTRRVKDNAIYVLQLNGSLLVKRVQRKLDGSVMVKSDNVIYEPEKITADMLDTLNVIGRVVWCGRRM